MAGLPELGINGFCAEAGKAAAADAISATTIHHFDIIASPSNGRAGHPPWVA